MSVTNQPVNSGVFPDVQTAVRDRLASFSHFGGIRMVLQQDGDIDSKIETALAELGDDTTRPGAAYLIATPMADDPTSSIGIKLDPFQVTVSCVENTVFNEGDAGTGRRSLEWAILALAALKGWTPAGCLSPLVGYGKALTLTPSRGTKVIWTVSLKTKINIPLLRHPGEHGYTDTEPEPARI